MQNHTDCQSCRRPADERLLRYTRDGAVLRREGLLQCDVCERYACAECLQVYQIVSSYDFICHDCVTSFGTLPRGARGH